ncbi:uncharacterized protein LOC134240086 [Saccostrea cucullata]|uniref:uncharacterized protein LOC134240086 n=1 Tax=Saccostrea cuccullata TaxID=36930 RepID=UPI002ED1F54E
MPPVRTKRRTLSRRQIETQQVSPFRGRPLGIKGEQRMALPKHQRPQPLLMWLPNPNSPTQQTNPTTQTVQTLLQVVQRDPSSNQLQKTTVQPLITQSRLTPMYTHWAAYQSK